MTDRLVVWQPVYFPRLHYLARLADADIFVIFDSAEFSRQSPQHRAPINHGGREWITVPISRSSDDQPITEAEIDMSQHWRKKHLKNIKYKYGGEAPEPFAEHFDNLSPGSTLPELTVPLLKELIDIFNIDIEIYRSSELDIPYTKGNASEYLARLTEDFDCGIYYCGENAYSKYLNDEPFSERGIEIEIQDWTPNWPDGNAICLDVVYESDSPNDYIN